MVEQSIVDWPIFVRSPVLYVYAVMFVYPNLRGEEVCDILYFVYGSRTFMIRIIRSPFFYIFFKGGWVGRGANDSVFGVWSWLSGVI